MLEVSEARVSEWQNDTLCWTVPAQDIADQILGLRFSPSRLLPPAIRWIGSRGTAWLVERPPTTAAFTVLTTDGHERRFDLILPWTYHFIELEEVRHRVFARPSELLGLDDELCYLPLPGMRTDGSLPLAALNVAGNLDIILKRALRRFDQTTWGGTIEQRLVPEALTLDALARAAMAPSTESFATSVAHVWSLLKRTSQVCSLGWKPVTRLSDLATHQAPDSFVNLFRRAAQAASNPTD